MKKEYFFKLYKLFFKKISRCYFEHKQKNKDFHARYSATRRTYKYLIVNRRSSLVLERNKAWHIKKKLDLKVMKKAAKILKGTHNFSTFRSSSCEAKISIKNFV